jgi:hypothetical protein
MYFNLTVDGPDVENKSGSSGVLVAFPCEKPEPTAARYVLRPQTAIKIFRAARSKASPG